MWDKITGRAYVVILALSAAAKSAADATNGPWPLWIIVITHLACAGWIAKDGVK